MTAQTGELLPADGKPPVPRRRGGRQKGTPNKPKRRLLARLEKDFPGYHPVIRMAEVANDETVSKELRFQANREVAAYLEPKLKAVEVTGANGGPMQVVFSIAGDDNL